MPKHQRITESNAHTNKGCEVTFSGEPGRILWSLRQEANGVICRDIRILFRCGSLSVCIGQSDSQAFTGLTFQEDNSAIPALSLTQTLPTTSKTRLRA